MKLALSDLAITFGVVCLIFSGIGAYYAGYWGVTIASAVNAVLFLWLPREYLIERRRWRSRENEAKAQAADARIWAEMMLTLRWQAIMSFRDHLLDKGYPPDTVVNSLRPLYVDYAKLQLHEGASEQVKGYQRIARERAIEGGPSPSVQ